MMDTRDTYREQVNIMGKKAFTLQKMQEYGFWPSDLPTPYERQQNETEQEFEQRKKLVQEMEQLSEQIAAVYQQKHDIEQTISALRRKYQDTLNYEKIRKIVCQEIMKESIKRRAERKQERERLQKQKSEAWQKKKAETILFIGKGYSGMLSHKETDIEKLQKNNLPILQTDKDLANFLQIPYQTLRYLVYHRDVITFDNYYRFDIPKKSGGVRHIAAPKTNLKSAQRQILENILQKIEISDCAHGFIKSKSVLTGATVHHTGPDLLINMDIADFFPTITFERVRGLYQSFGYSGYIASLLAMICTYCERMPVEIKGETKYVKTSERILPQGSPASPMITNIICRVMDKRIEGFCKKIGFTYTRYADDMSFSYIGDMERVSIGGFLNGIQKIVSEEGFEIKKEKTHILRKHNRQYITGIVINNSEIGVPRKWVKILRASIHNAEQLQNQGKPLPKETRMELKGKIAWLQSVNENRYKNLIEKGLSVLKQQ